MLKGFILPSLVKLDYSYQCRYRPLQIDECENDAFIFNEGLFVNSSKLEVRVATSFFDLSVKTL